MLTKSGPTALAQDPHLSPSTFDCEQGPQVPILTTLCPKITKMTTFPSHVTSARKSHPGPFGTTLGHSGTLKKVSLGTWAQNPHPWPFELTRPEIQASDQKSRNDHPWMPQTPISGLCAFCDHFPVTFHEHESKGLENLAMAGHPPRWPH